MLATDAHGGFGGIAQYNRDVIEAMVGFDRISEIVVLLRTMPASHVSAPAKVTYDLAGVAGTRAFIACALMRALKDNRFDLVYCAHINLMPLARVISSLCRAPLVLAIYGIDAWVRPASLITRWSARSARYVISISQITLDRFRAWSGIDERACAILPNAIDTKNFVGGARNPALERRMKVAGRKVIMTLGRMAADEQYKGFDEVLNVIPRLICKRPDLVYIAAGDGSDRSRLEAKARILGIADHVIFTGYVDEVEKADLYRLADAYVMPSSGEGFGFVVLEAIACGIPVVASSVDGTREAVRSGELGRIVDPKDLDALEGAILEALATHKAIPAGLDYFSFENFQTRLKAVLARVVPV